MNRTSIQVTQEVSGLLERIIVSLPVSERVRTKEDAVMWLWEHLDKSAKIKVKDVKL